MAKKGRKKDRVESARSETSAKPRWATRLLRGALLWLVPVALVWIFVTPVYNAFLTRAAENLTRLFEDPAATRLVTQGRDHFVITRTDTPTADGGVLGSVRVTDTHFPLVLMSVLFLAVPGASLRRRLEGLGWALLISAFFHIFSLFLWVQFTYATQLGEWSLERYGPVARNGWGLAKHLADLPFKFGVPLALWAFFFLGDLLRRDDPDR